MREQLEAQTLVAEERGEQIMAIVQENETLSETVLATLSLVLFVLFSLLPRPLAIDAGSFVTATVRRSVTAGVQWCTVCQSAVSQCLAVSRSGVQCLTASV